MALMTQTVSNAFTILLAGPITPTARLRSQIEGTRVIAADGGIAHARTLELTPELWVGDFDSSNESDGNLFPDLERRTYPAAKAATDGALAVEEAIARGATSLTLIGAFGGRTDHTFALMTQACALTHAGMPTLMTDGLEEATTLLPTPKRYDYQDGTQFSVLAFSALEGLTLTGAEWPLDAIVMPFGDTLTISNVVKDGLTASLESGRALLLAHLG